LERPDPCGIIVSRRCEAAARAAVISRIAERCGDPNALFVSGFHSPVEKECLDALLKGRAGIIYIPACRASESIVRSEWLEALENNRMLIVSPFDNVIMDRATALERNDLVHKLRKGILNGFPN
jgi:hypothetical protein